MSKFKVGDKVKVVQDFRTWLNSSSGRSEASQAFTVIDTKEGAPEGRENTNHTTKEIELYAVTKYPEDFKIHIFDIGDKIICDRPESSNWYKKGDILTVRGVPFVDRGEWCVHVEEQDNDMVWVTCHQFDKVITALNALITRVTTLDDMVSAPSLEPHLSVISSPTVEANKLGIYRPDIETRKVGKVQIELVDTGFPNALWELAKLMSWAAENKGYKPNDWKNIPNAGVAFPAAASRHRMKPLLGELYDPESNLFHKVHELFNVAAELELMLTGVIVK